MMKIERTACPQWLEQNYQQWGLRWQRQVLDPNRNNSFSWYQYNNHKINHLLIPVLLEISENHCSFCDRRPVGVETVDHFSPKVTFPLEAYAWDNLFISCYDCQVSRWDDFDTLLIKPDHEEYQFGNFFKYDPNSGKLEPKGTLDSVSYRMADVTIRLFRLNERGLPEARKLISDNKTVFSEYDLNLVPFRFVFYTN